MEGGAIFDSNFGNSIFGIPLSPPTQIRNNIFSNNAIVGVPAGIPSPVFFFNQVANGFTNNLSTVTSMAPGGGAIAVVFSGSAKISSNAFTTNIALGASPGDPNRGGAILVGGVVGTPVATELANACLIANLFTGNKADIDDDVAVYNPAGIPGGVAVSLCPVPVKEG